MMANMSRLVEFLYELGMLKKTPRMGWLTIGISDAESIADHSFRTAIIGYALARLAKADEDKVVKLCLFHDLHETRIGDLNALNLRYLRKEEERAVKEIVSELPFGEELIALSREFSDGKTLESVLARDADRLEMIVQAKEYMEEGNPLAEEWIKSAIPKLQTDYAKELAEEVLKTPPSAWWKRYKF